MKRGISGKFKGLILLGLLLSLNMPSLAFINLGNPSVEAGNLIQLVNYTSKHVKITGTVCSSKLSDNSKVIFLNFGDNFNTSLSAVIYDFDVHSFISAGINPQNYFENKKVVLEGVIRIANGKPEVVINSPKQIKIIEAAKPQN